MSTFFACYNPGAPVTHKTMDEMVSASDYWHPDAIAQASCRDDRCRIARAALFDTGRSRQETVWRDEADNLIAANVRLDNRSELAAAMGIAAADSVSMPDGALILAAYRRWGEACPELLFGDFAFVIWDEAAQRLFCARDHFGVRLLFYGVGAHGFMATNEHNAFFASGGFPKQIKEEWLVRHLWAPHDQPFESPFLGIKLLPPAHSVSFGRDGTPQVRRYWELREREDWRGMGDEALIGELGRRFVRAVEVRLESDHPLAAELTEGLDSNGIAGVASRLLGQRPLMTLSYDCVPLSGDNRHIWEKTYQDIFEVHALHPNLQPLWQQVDAEGREEEDRSVLARHFGGVMAINGMHFRRTRIASAHGARVLLSGFGGDQCVSSKGNGFENELLSQGRWRDVHQSLLARQRRNGGRYPLAAWVNLLLKHGMPSLYPWLQHHVVGNASMRLLRQRGRISFVNPALVDRYGLQANLWRYLCGSQHRSVRQHHLWWLFNVEVEARLAESELCGRMHRLEQRFPMLDVRLVEFAYNAPSHLKMHDGVDRYMFRRILDGLTTERIRWRRKEDIHFPNIRHRDTLRPRLQRFAGQFDADGLSRRYCDPKRLAKKVSGEIPTWNQEIRSMQLLLDVEVLAKKGEIEVVEGRETS